MRKGPIFLSLAVVGLGLAGCHREAGQTPAAPATGVPIASLPLAQGAPPPLIAAPALAALPSAPPVPIAAIAPKERYRYIDRAEALGETFADSPPDYTVDYDGVRPWIWRSNRGEYRVVEPTSEGQRIYYFDAGSDQPFLVSDPEHSYGFAQGELTAVYAPDGRLIGYDPASAERAARYLARARALYDAALHQQRQAAYAEAWRERRRQVLAEQQAWAAEQQRDDAWRAWRDQHRRAEQPDWDRERAARVAYAATIATVITTAANHDHDQGRPSAPPVGQPPPPPGPGPQGSPPNGGPPGPRDDHRDLLAGQQQQAQAAQQAQLAQAAAARQQAEAMRAARADAAHKAQAQAGQLAAARQQAEAGRAQQAAQSAAAHQAQAQAHAEAARQQAEVAREAQADAAHKAQAQAGQLALARQQADTAHAQQAAQAAAAHQAQAQVQA